MATVTAKKVLLKDEFGNAIIPYTISEKIIGEIISVNASANYVPNGCLPCDGAEYTKAQFSDLWNNYLTGGISSFIEENWQENTGYFYKKWKAFAYGGGKYVLVGEDGYISTSDDGVTWGSAKVPGGTADKLDVAYGNGCFIATSENSGYFLLSSDGGNTWSNAYVGGAQFNKYWNKIVFGNGRFVAISLTGDAVTTPVPTIKWEGVVGWAGDITNWRSLAYGNGIFIAISDAGYVSTTIDGLNWTTPKLIHEAGFNCINFDDANNRFIINTDDDLIISTIDGSEFNTIGTIPVTGALNSNFVIGAGKAITINVGSGTVYETTDFNTWTSTLISDRASLGNWLLGYDNKKFFIFSNSNIGTALAYSKTYYKETKTLLNTCSYTDYEADMATYGQCAKFAVDIDNETFRVPLIKEGSVIQQALSNAELGKSYNAGLPNIEGSFNTVYVHSQGSSSGATVSELASDHQFGGTGAKYYKFNTTLDASRSNSIYGNSDTVQMNAVALRYFVVVANCQTNQSMMDWSAWASSLQGKLNADHSNDSKPYIVETSDKSILPSWYRVWSDGWCEQGGHLGTASATSYTITFLKEFVDTNYSLLSTDSTGAGSNSDTEGATQCVYLGNYTTTSFTASIDSGRWESSWEAKGYIR